ncbi:MAG: hypothetical protein ACK50R_05545, partial [Planctomycetota bacterium]
IEPIDFGWSACPTASIGIALLGHDGMTTQNAKRGPQPKATSVTQGEILGDHSYLRDNHQNAK